MALFKMLFGKKKEPEITTKEKTVNVLVMGKAAVGKTSLIRRLVGDETFSEKHIPTLYDDMVKDVNIEGTKVSFKFMELGGSHAFPTMLDVFIRQAHVYILTYAADDAESHNALIQLREKIVSIKGKCYSELSIIVVRNKVDIHRKGSKEDKVRRKSVANWCYLHHYVSAKTGLRINAIMDILIEESKFIGNEQDETNFHVSGRYIYTEKPPSKSLFRSKSFRIFSNADKMNRRMNKRRLGFRKKKKEEECSVEERQIFVSTPTLKRSLSLTIRQSMRWLKHKNKDCLTNDQPSPPIEVPSENQRKKAFMNRASTWPEPNTYKSVDIQKDTSEPVSRTKDFKTFSLDEAELGRNRSSTYDLQRERKKGVGSSNEVKENSKDAFSSSCEQSIPIKPIIKSATFCVRNQQKSKNNYSLSFDDSTLSSTKIVTENIEDGNINKEDNNKAIVTQSCDTDCQDGDGRNMSEKKDLGEYLHMKPLGSSTTTKKKCTHQIPWMRLKSLSQNHIEHIDDMFTVNITKEQEKRLSAIFKSSKSDVKASSGSISMKEKLFDDSVGLKRIGGSFREKFGFKDSQHRTKYSFDEKHNSGFSIHSSGKGSKQSVKEITEKEATFESHKTNYCHEIRKAIDKHRCTSFTNKRDTISKTKPNSFDQPDSRVVKQPLSKKDSYSLNDIRYVPSRY